jgi:hypothetical protein
VCLNGGLSSSLHIPPSADPEGTFRAMPSGTDVGNAVGDSRIKLGLIGPSGGPGSATPFLIPFGPIFGRYTPCGLLMWILGVSPKV